MPVRVAKKKKKGSTSVNTCSSKSAAAVLRYAIGLRPGVYEEESVKPGKGNILWAVHSYEHAGLTRLKPSQCVSRVPGMADMCQKCMFARAMLEGEDADDSDDDDDDDSGDFWPKTWILPEDSKQLKAELRRNGRRRASRKKTYIFKPDSGSQGDGIVLFRKLDDLLRVEEASKRGCSTTAVVQEYLASPLLLDGCKFDLRKFIFSVHLLEIYTARQYTDLQHSRWNTLTRDFLAMPANKGVGFPASLQPPPALLTRSGATVRSGRKPGLVTRVQM
jgi:hypothetical protein